MLLAVLVHTKALKVNVAARAELGLHGARDVDRALHGKLLHSALDHGELDRDLAGHFDGTAERDLAIALREVQISRGELRALDVHGQVDLGAAGEVLDIAVAAVFGSTWHRSCSFFAVLGQHIGRLESEIATVCFNDGERLLYEPNFLLQLRIPTADMDGLGLRRQSDLFVHVAALADELRLALIPHLENLVRWRTAQDSRVDEASELDAGDVARAAVDAFEVPDSLRSRARVVSQSVQDSDPFETLTLSGRNRSRNRPHSPARTRL